MGHMVHGGVYKALQQRLNDNVTGAPATDAMIELLKLRFSHDDAALAVRMPHRPASGSSLSRALGIALPELERRLETMAEKGLVFDFDLGGVRHFMLAPAVIGFVEFTYMRLNHHATPEITALPDVLHRLETADIEFAKAVFAPGSTTQIGRVLPHETQLPSGDHASVLDYDTASAVLSEQDVFAVGTCYCRHQQEHLGTPCSFPQEVCLSMGMGAEFMIRRQMAKQIDRAEACDILAMCRDRGLVHIADNVQRRIGYICNCCKCCCGQLRAITQWGLNNAVVTSRYIAIINPDRCTGCGACLDGCPVNALSLSAPSDAHPRGVAVVDDGICLGCGVCATACRPRAAALAPRQQRVLTPEGTIERILLMALERGKLAPLVFPNNPSSLTQRWATGLLRAILNLPPAKRLLLHDRVKSTFVRSIIQLLNKTDTTQTIQELAQK